MNAEQQKQWDKYVDLLMSMGLDARMGRGPTKAGFVNNLRLMADNMEKLLTPAEPRIQSEDGKPA